MLKSIFAKLYSLARNAGVAQLVELLPSKQTVARSSRVARSNLTHKKLQENVKARFLNIE